MAGYKEKKLIQTFKMLYLHGNEKYPNGMPVLEICDKLDVQKSRAYEWVKKYDLKREKDRIDKKVSVLAKNKELAIFADLKVKKIKELAALHDVITEKTQWAFEQAKTIKDVVQLLKAVKSSDILKDLHLLNDAPTEIKELKVPMPADWKSLSYDRLEELVTSNEIEEADYEIEETD